VDATLLPGEMSQIQNSVPSLLYSVHISSSKKKTATDRAIKKICQEGLEAFGMVVQLPDMGTWYRILVGYYDTREEAESLANRLKENGSFPYPVVTSIPRGDIKIKPEIKGSRL
jgi:hypothetical protein